MRRDLGLLAAIGVAIGAAGALLNHPETAVFHKIVGFAVWLRGDGPKPEVATWPAWGYAWVIAWVRDFAMVVVLQACLGGVALAVFARSLGRSMPRQESIIAFLCVLAVPWHDMQVTLYPSGVAGSLLILALLSLAEALSSNRLKMGILAGVLIGFAQNLRTEFVLLPALLGICAQMLSRWRIVSLTSTKPLWAFVLAAFVLQLPWAFFYHAETGRYSLTESNFGHVLYVSLGSDPHNPWKIEGDDQGAMRAMREQGYSFSSLSESGNQVLRRLVWDKVKQHPGGLVARTVQQLRNTVVAPFNWGEPKLDGRGTRDLDVLRQELKAHIGVGINVSKLNEYRGRELIAEAKHDHPAVAALLYQILAVGAGAVVFLLGICGMMLALARNAATRPQPLMWFLACTALYKTLQDVLLAYQVNYLNNVYPMFLPFVAISLTAIYDHFRGPAMRAVAAASP